MPSAQKSIAYKSLSNDGIAITTAFTEATATANATTIVRSGYFVNHASGLVGLPCTAAATTAAVTNGFLGMAVTDSIGADGLIAVTTTNARSINVAIATPQTLFGLPFAAGTGTAFATTATAPAVGTTYQIGFGTPSGGAKQFYCDTTTVNQTAVATSTSLIGTVHSVVNDGGAYKQVFVVLNGVNRDSLTGAR
jgi:hypothetical protein